MLYLHNRVGMDVGIHRATPWSHKIRIWKSLYFFYHTSFSLDAFHLGGVNSR